MNPPLLPSQAERLLTQWADERHATLRQQEPDRALLAVGPLKPLGSMGFSSFREMVIICRDARRRGLQVRVNAYPWDDFNPPWFVCVWHPRALRALLMRNADLLRAERWIPRGPIRGTAFALGLTRHLSCKEFVRLTTERRAAPGTALFDLIADAYGDKTGPGRSDVLPEFPRRALLAAYEQRWGQPDPTAHYFPAEDRPTPDDFPDAPLWGIR